MGAGVHELRVDDLDVVGLDRGGLRGRFRAHARNARGADGTHWPLGERLARPIRKAKQRSRSGRPLLFTLKGLRGVCLGTFAWFRTVLMTVYETT